MKTTNLKVNDMDPREIWIAMIRVGITQKQIGDQLGLRKSTVNNVIRGRSVSHRIRMAISKAIGIDIVRIWPSTYLYGGGPKGPGRPRKHQPCASAKRGRGRPRKQST